MPQTFWTIGIDGSKMLTAAEWGINHDSLRPTFRINAISEITFQTTVADFIGDPVFNFRDWITVRGGVTLNNRGTINAASGYVLFRGMITGVQRSGSGPAEALQYTAECPFRRFENTTFQQSRAFATLTIPPNSNITKDITPEVIIPFSTGVDSTQPWSVLTCQQQIIECINFVINQTTPALPLQLGGVVINPAGYDAGTLPLRKEREKTPGQIIRLMLGYTPDAALWIDHTTQPSPTINVKRWSALASKTITLNRAGVIANPAALNVGDAVLSVAVTSLENLTAHGVSIQFQRPTTINGTQVAMYLEKQVWPPGTTGLHDQDLAHIVDLVGLDKVFQEAEVVTDPMNAAHADPATRVAWWKKHHPAYANGLYTDIVISDVLIFDAEDPNELAPGAGYPVQNLANDLVPPSNIPPWLLYHATQNPTGVKAQRVKVRAKVSFKRWKDTAHAQLSLSRAVGDEVTIVTEIVITNATTKLYRSDDIVTQQAEPVPSNLAQFEMEGVGVTHYKGAVMLKGAEIFRGVALGDRLNLANGRPEWAAMNALVSQIQHDVGAGLTTITFGPPAHLSAAQYREFLRMNQGLQRANPNTANTGRLGTENRVSAGGYAPRRNATSEPGGGGGGGLPVWLP